MRQRERQHNTDAASGDDSISNLSKIREQADRFLSAGDEAINRALINTDSEAFLEANRQNGGE